jgi:hypothetical protein
MNCWLLLLLLVVELFLKKKISVWKELVKHWIARTSTSSHQQSHILAELGH